MGLNLTKYRKSEHYHIGVAGSYTDTLIEVLATSSSSEISGASNAFCRWVPNKKSTSTSDYYSSNTGTITINSTLGYLEYSSTTPGYHLLIFDYFDDSNQYNNGTTSPGIRLVETSTYAAGEGGANSLASALNAWRTADEKDQFIVIFNNGRVCSSSMLNYEMLRLRSWKHEPTMNDNTAIQDWTYAAVATNIIPTNGTNGALTVNHIGMLSESLMGHNNANNASVEINIEHKRRTIGHAGYGYDLSSGIGNGPSGIGITSSTHATTPQNGSYGGTNGSWSQQSWKEASYGEYIRATYESRMGQGVYADGGHIRVGLSELNGSYGVITGTNPPNSRIQPTDFWTKQEVLLKRGTSATSGPYRKVNIDVNFGNSNQTNFNKIDIRNLQVYKCGLGPDDHDGTVNRGVAVHKWHVNALNIESSPFQVPMGAPDEFETFWGSDRNLVSSLQQYSYNNVLSTTSEEVSMQSGNSVSVSHPQGGFTYPRFGFTNFNTTNQSNKKFWVRECRNATQNHSTAVFFNGTNSIAVDHTKMYLAGIWVRVREETNTGQTTAPNRISLIAGAKNSSGTVINMYGSSGSVITSSAHAQQSIYANNYALTADRQEWKLLSGFYLPSWMSATERTTWKEDYYGTWEGPYGHGEGTNPDIQMSGITGYGITTLSAGYVAGMTTSTASITPSVLCEQYQATDLWAEFVYPFVVEIDPANFTSDEAIFWDFSEA